MCLNENDERRVERAYSTNSNMAICEKCGREIPEGGVCECQSAGVNQVNPAAPETAGTVQAENVQGVPAPNNAPTAPQPAAQPTAPQPAAQPPSDGISSFVNDLTSDPKKLLLLLIPVAVIFLIIAVILIVTLSGGYKKPINDFVKGYNSNNCELIINSMLPKDAVKEAKSEVRDSGSSWKETMSDMNDMLKSSKETSYGKGSKLSVKIISKNAVDKDELRSLRSTYDTVSDKYIDKAYKVKARVTMKTREDSDSERTTIYVVHFKNDGWKMAMGNSGELNSFAPSLWSLF